GFGGATKILRQQFDVPIPGRTYDIDAWGSLRAQVARQPFGLVVRSDSHRPVGWKPAPGGWVRIAWGEHEHAVPRPFGGQAQLGVRVAREDQDSGPPGLRP